MCGIHLGPLFLQITCSIPQLATAVKGSHCLQKKTPHCPQPTNHILRGVPEEGTTHTEQTIVKGIHLPHNNNRWHFKYTLKCYEV